MSVDSEESVAECREAPDEDRTHLVHVVMFKHLWSFCELVSKWASSWGQCQGAEMNLVVCSCPLLSFVYSTSPCVVYWCWSIFVYVCGGCCTRCCSCCTVLSSMASHLLIKDWDFPFDSFAFSGRFMLFLRGFQPKTVCFRSFVCRTRHETWVRVPYGAHEREAWLFLLVSSIDQLSEKCNARLLIHGFSDASGSRLKVNSFQSDRFTAFLLFWSQSEISVLVSFLYHEWK